MGEAREKKYTHFVNALRNKYFSLVFSFFVSCFASKTKLINLKHIN